MGEERTMDLSVWVGCMAHYNNGELIGAWIDAKDAGEWVCPKQDPNNVYINCEETWCYDHEILWIDGELSPMEAVAWAEIAGEVEDHEVDAFTAWVKEYFGKASAGDVKVSAFRDECRGAYDSMRDFAMEWAGETLLGDLGVIAREHDKVYRGHSVKVVEQISMYFDYDKYARDLFVTGFDYVDGFVFRNE
jgi:antirestriction protein